MPGRVLRLKRVVADEFGKDISGRGASLFPGRWNVSKQHVIYAARTTALCMIETFVHLKPYDKLLPPNRTLQTLAVDLGTSQDRTRVRRVRRNTLPDDLFADEAAILCRRIGGAWYDEDDGPLILEVPSADCPGDAVYVIHRRHRHSARVRLESTAGIPLPHRFSIADGLDDTVAERISELIQPT